MSRSGYSDDLGDSLQAGHWRAVIASATRGKRGQRFFRELVAALDSMPVKRLISGELEREGSFCALGVLCERRGMDLAKIDTHNWAQLGESFDIAEQLAQETMFVNDEYDWRGGQSDEARWQTVRDWAARQIVPTEEELS
jgi:hypothetical protein